MASLREYQLIMVPSSPHWVWRTLPKIPDTSHYNFILRDKGNGKAETVAKIGKRILKMPGKHRLQEALFTYRNIPREPYVLFPAQKSTGPAFLVFLKSFLPTWQLHWGFAHIPSHILIVKTLSHSHCKYCHIFSTYYPLHCFALHQGQFLILENPSLSGNGLETVFVYWKETLQFYCINNKWRWTSPKYVV